MKAQLILLLALLAPLPALSIGYVYTGVGDDGRQNLELTSVTVDVQIDERIARTRTDQIFTNHAEWVVEGIYEFTLPEGAIITDLVLWIDDKRTVGGSWPVRESRGRSEENNTLRAFFGRHCPKPKILPRRLRNRIADLRYSSAKFRNTRVGATRAANRRETVGQHLGAFRLGVARAGDGRNAPRRPLKPLA